MGKYAGLTYKQFVGLNFELPLSEINMKHFQFFIKKT